MFISKKKHKQLLYEETQRFYDIGKRHGYQNCKIERINDKFVYMSNDEKKCNCDEKNNEFLVQVIRQRH